VFIVPKEIVYDTGKDAALYRTHAHYEQNSDVHLDDLRD
jgi:hypothetical protein